MSFVSATETFIESADWLTSADAPAVGGMRAAARELDEGLNPPLLAQYRLFYDGLMKKRPKEDAGDVDPLEAALRDAAE